jgi:hypothetical protein
MLVKSAALPMKTKSGRRNAKHGVRNTIAATWKLPNTPFLRKQSSIIDIKLSAQPQFQRTVLIVGVVGGCYFPPLTVFAGYNPLAPTRVGVR